MQCPQNQARSASLISGLILLPVLYFLSIGPFSWASQYCVGWLESRNAVHSTWFDPATQQWCSASGSPDYQEEIEVVMGCLYAPVFWLADTWEPAGEVLFRYMNLFGDG